MRAHNNYQNWIIKSVLLCCVIALLTGIFIINPLFAYAEDDTMPFDTQELALGNAFDAAKELMDLIPIIIVR